MGREEKMYTIKEVEGLTGIKASTIRVWLSDERRRGAKLPNARLEETPIGSYWRIPESDLAGIMKRESGRPPAAPAKKPARKPGRKGK